MKMRQVYESIRASYEQSQESIKSLTFENRSLVQKFDSERLRLEKLHLQEISRLHKAVKTMKKKAISFCDRPKMNSDPSQNTLGQSKESLATVVSESEGMTTITASQPQIY